MSKSGNSIGMDKDIVVFYNVFDLNFTKRPAAIFHAIMIKTVTLIEKELGKFLQPNAKAIEEPRVDFTNYRRQMLRNQFVRPAKGQKFCPFNVTLDKRQVIDVR